MKKLLRLLLFAFLPLAGSVYAQEDEDIGGRYTGAAKNQDYRAVCTLLITETLPGFFLLSGSVAVAARGEARARTLQLDGNASDTDAAGTLTYKNAKGKRVRVSFTGAPEINGKYGLQFRAREFGRFKFVLRKALDISGIWSFNDGRTGPMSITWHRSGGEYRGSYRGTESAGHPDLTGFLSGSLSSRGVWSGNFTITEPNQDEDERTVTVRGKFSLQYSEPPGLSPILKGPFTTAGGSNEITLTKQ